MNTLKTIAILSLGIVSGAAALAANAEKGCETGVCSLDNAPKTEGIVLLTTGEMKKIVDAKSALVFDARTGKYDDGQRIPGAKALSPEASATEVAKAIPDKNAKVVAYCANLKCPAGGMLAKRLVELGYKNVNEYPEGIQGWMAAGHPVEKAAK
jgi:rhodanese-related sulfurtransferase